MYRILKKFIVLTFINIILSQAVCAITLDEGKQAFQKYVKESNACSMAFINMYDKSSVIKRIVLNANGSSYTKIIPIAAYKTMLLGYSKAALWQGYRNTYTNISFQQNGDDVIVKAIRHPSTSSEKLPATLVFGTNSKGKIIIKEESFHTNASFLLK